MPSRDAADDKPLRQGLCPTLRERDQRRVEAALTLFMDQPFHPGLKNHGLTGKLRGLRAIKAGHDLRVVYEEEGGHATVLLLNTGTHDQVY